MDSLKGILIHLVKNISVVKIVKRGISNSLYFILDFTSVGLFIVLRDGNSAGKINNNCIRPFNRCNINNII